MLWYVLPGTWLEIWPILSLLGSIFCSDPNLQHAQMYGPTTRLLARQLHSISGLQVQKPSKTEVYSLPVKVAANPALAFPSPEPAAS